ncbi:hypothetical protein N9H08_00445 [bacterium]|nr:hypothetical protein [bacterium]
MAVETVEDCVNDRISEGFTPFKSPVTLTFYYYENLFVYLQAMVKYADD